MGMRRHPNLAAVLVAGLMTGFRFQIGFIKYIGPLWLPTTVKCLTGLSGLVARRAEGSSGPAVDHAPVHS